MEAKIPLAFAAGLLSFATPCVLPLVPAYLATVSGREVGARGGRVVGASLPFRVEPFWWHQVNEGDRVLVRHLPHTSSVESFEKL